LSLLVYFDRMTERVNSSPMQSLRQSHDLSMEYQRPHSEGSVSITDTDPSPRSSHPAAAATPPSSGQLGAQHRSGLPDSPSFPPEPPLELDPFNLSHFFVVDSFNIHRLVIAGVTCASKFFSDVFYTNSRYAKVGGLPLVELNHLELQFLILNDFRLSVPVETLEAYGTMLVEFYAREIMEQRQGEASMEIQTPTPP